MPEVWNRVLSIGMTRRRGWIAPWVLALLLIPRIVRFIYPAVWVEDDPLLETALATSRGLRPYIDFTLAQLPLLEWIAAGYIKIAGASLHSMELLNGAAIYATSVLIVLVGRRTVGESAALAGGFLFASSSLVFRYHLWAREFFVTALVLGAALVVLNDRVAVRAQVLAFAALVSTAVAIKLTAAVSVAGLLLFIAFVLRRPARALAAAGATAAALTAFAGVCYRLYGFEFIYQTFLFHFLKGTLDAGIGYPASILDVLAPLFALGAIALLASRPWLPALPLVWCVLGPLLLFLAILSPTAWGHNYLDLLPWIAMVAGGGIVWIFREMRRPSWRPLAAIAFTVVCVTTVTPLKGENASRDSVYGFGFVPRAEVAQLASALSRATAADEEVVAPSFIAFAANRIPRLRFPENYGVIREGERRYRAQGFWSAREDFGQRNFFDLINETSMYWNGQFINATAAGGPVNAVILDSDIQFIPLVNATDAALTERAFSPVLRTAHYTLWLRPH
jgi:hypothetical protein